MHRAKKALIIIDMLRDFMEKNGALYCSDKARKIIPFVKKTMIEFRKKKALIIYAKDSHAPNDKEFELFGRHCVRGSQGSQVIREIKPERGDWIVPKNTYDATFKSGLVRVLRRNRIRDVFLVGVCTSICVMESASSLTKLGFRINVLKRGVADFDSKSHNLALKRMKFLYGAKIV